MAGLSFKEDIDDFRYSHGVKIARRLVEEGYGVYVHDPYLDENVYTTLPKDLDERIVKVYDLSNLGDMDFIVFATRHKGYRDLNECVFPSSVKVIDLWNSFRGKINVDGYEPLSLKK